MKESVKEVPNFIDVVLLSMVWQGRDFLFLLILCFLTATFCVGKYPNYACLSL